MVLIRRPIRNACDSVREKNQYRSGYKNFSEMNTVDWAHLLRCISQTSLKYAVQFQMLF